MSKRGRDRTASPAAAQEPQCEMAPTRTATWKHTMKHSMSEHYSDDVLAITVYENGTGKASMSLTGGKYKSSTNMLLVPPGNLANCTPTVDDLRCIARQLNAAADQMDEWTS